MHGKMENSKYSIIARIKGGEDVRGKRSEKKFKSRRHNVLNPR
jgi:hypothetical protein